MVGVGTSTWELDTKKAKNEKNNNPKTKQGRLWKDLTLSDNQVLGALA